MDWDKRYTWDERRALETSGYPFTNYEFADVTLATELQPMFLLTKIHRVPLAFREIGMPDGYWRD